MSGFGFTYPIVVNGATVAEIDGTVDPGQVRGAINDDLFDVTLHAYRDGKPVEVEAPEPLRGQILVWLWSTDRARMDEAIAAARAGTIVYDREIARESAA